MIKCNSLILLVFLSACSINADSKDKLVSKSIEACVAKYKLESRKSPLVEIDRVYLHVSGNLANLIFTRGEMGTFGTRSNHFQSFYSCGVKLNEVVSVVYVQNSRFEELYHLEGFDLSTLNFKDQQVTEHMYLKNGLKYLLHGKQAFNPEVINKF